MAETNPLTELSDLGLVSPSLGDPLGSANAIQELQQHLSSVQAMLNEPPPGSNTFLSSAIQGALAGSQGVLEDPLTGMQTAAPSEGGFGAGFLTGIGSAIESKEKDALAQYLQRQRQAQSAQDQHEKLSSGVRTVLGQNPLAFEALGQTHEGQLLLGQLAYGMPIPIDPTAKSRGVEETLARKQLIAFYTQGMKSAVDPGTRAEFANKLQDIVDPDKKLSIDASGFVRGAVPTRAEAVKLYGDEGIRALEDYHRSGDLDALLTRLSSLDIKEPDKMPASMRADMELAGAIAQVIRDNRELGVELTDDEAIKQLPEELRIRAQKKYGSKKPGEIGFDRMVLEIGKAFDDVPLDVRESDPAQAELEAFNRAFHRVRAAQKMQARMQKTQPAAVAPVTPAGGDIKIKTLDPKKWGDMVRTRKKLQNLDAAAANRALVNEYLNNGKADQIPASARKAAGL